ncbi:sigma factor-like helix-turn-helix DNA-binding protein [Furfurilactobacillus siliginis]|nr:sigma factor-like helix-turn-helix DNA-binding protein [Furfurilactobacillus siliginis]
MRKHKQSTFEWLNEYLELKDECHLLEWKIRKTKHEEWRWLEGDLAGVRINGKSKGSHVSDNLPKLESDLKTCENEMNTLLQIVDTFQGYENDILRLKYIDGLSIEDIAEKLNLSVSTVSQRHAELHRRLDFIDHWEQKRKSFNDRLDVDFVEM